MVDATDVETTERCEGCGQATRQRKVTDKHGTMHESEVTVCGWKVIILIGARTKIPLAVQVVSIQAHETRWLRALVVQAQAHLASAARLHKLVFEKGFGDGTDLWWLDQRGITPVVPAKAHMAVTADARQPPGLPDEPDQRGRSAQVEWAGRRARGENRLPDQRLGAAALAALG